MSPTPFRTRLSSALIQLTARSLAAGFAVLVIAGLLPASADAHPALLQSSPAAGVVAPKPTSELEIVLSEPAVLEGSRMSVREIAGPRIAASDLRLASGKRTMVIRTSKPLTEGVYEVDWSALGADGHLVSGKYAFGIAGKGGKAPQGIAALAAVGSQGGGRGGENAQLESGVTVVARWLTIITASFLFGGFALLEWLRRRLGADALPEATERWRLAAPLIALLLVFAVSGLVIANATAGAGGGFDLNTLLDSPTGKGVVAQAVIALLGLLAVPLLARRQRARDLALGLSGAGVLLGQALTGHVQTLDSGIALAAILQSIHVLSAGLWLGGLVGLLLLARPGEDSSGPSVRVAARAFAPVAAGALGLAAITGVIAAFREVDQVYFLRWSSYGTVVIIKAVLVVVAGAIGTFAFLRARRGADPDRPMRFELTVAAVIAVFAAVLGGLVPGRGQPLPAQRGTLLPGPAIASAVEGGSPVRLTLAPALAGDNTISVVQDANGDDPLPKQPKQVDAKLFCGCSKGSVNAKLTRDDAGVWSSDVKLPVVGSWYARLAVDGKRSAPVSLPVGVPQASGPGPLNVLSVADLSGPEAARCRSHLLGLQLAIGRLNAIGGLDGGRKVTLLAVDSQGSPQVAAAKSKQAIVDDDPIALAAPCGKGGDEAVNAAAEAGLPSIVGDPAVAPTSTEKSFRLAPDPYAEGYADGQYIKQAVVPSAKSNVIRAVDSGDEIAARRIEGVKAAVAGSNLRVRTVPQSRLDRGAGSLQQLLDEGNTAAFLADSASGPGRLEHELASLGEDRLDFATAPVIPADRVFSEDLVNRSGAIGRIGAVQGPTELQTSSETAQSYAQAVPALYPGERPTLDGLRGYITGLALTEGLKDGTGASSIAARLQQPPPFTDALLSPWRSDAPNLGSTQFLPIKAQFLPPTLIPADKGGETFNGTYFPDGSWTAASTQPLGPPFDKPLPALSGG